MTSHEATPPPDPQRDTDLDACEREPIHLLGRIQSYGALIAVSSDWLVQFASENLSDVIGPEAADPVGRPLAEIIPETTLRHIRRRLRNVETGDRATRIFDLGLGETLFDVSIHQSDRHLVIEFEPKRAPRDRDILAQTYPLIQKVREGATLDTVAQEGARALQALSGFDSVMVYRFEPDQSGTVIAQSQIGRGPDYLGLRFPASDIPPQARALYQRALLRLIADVDDPGAAVLPERAPLGGPLDLSLAVTRAVSPIHIEYLRNMGVAASMSVSIIKDGQLWGLFACHHRSPRHVDFETRTAIELFAHLFSYELTRLQEGARSLRDSRLRSLHRQLLRQLAEGHDLADMLRSAGPDIAELIPHDGLMFYADGTLTTQGRTPDAGQFEGLRRFLNTTSSDRIFATEALPQEYGPAGAFTDAAAGILAIPVSRNPRDYLVLCRGELAQDVVWAGDPRKSSSADPDGARLSPRKSFAAWREAVAGQSAPWTGDSLAAADSLRALLLEIFLRLSDAGSAEHKRTQERQELLIAELNHRVRNILNLMRGLITQGRGAETSVERFASSLDGRIQSLARAHDQLTRKNWAPGSLRELLQLEFAAYVEQIDRVAIRGADVLVAPEAYTTTALVMHEMVTNSVKYGALGSTDGKVEVTLRRDASGAVDIDWTERGGPAVAPPERRGFGTAIIERSIPYELGGEAEIHYHSAGVAAHFHLPRRHLSEPENIVQLERVRRETTTMRPALSGAALVVEDAMIIAMDAADILTEFGASDVRIAASVSEALELVSQTAFEVALLDVNLGGAQSLPVAEELARRNVPFVLATGYGDQDDLRATFPPSPIVQKPFSNDSIADALVRAGLVE